MGQVSLCVLARSMTASISQASSKRASAGRIAQQPFEGRNVLLEQIERPAYTSARRLPRVRGGNGSHGHAGQLRHDPTVGVVAAGLVPPGDPVAEPDDSQRRGPGVNHTEFAGPDAFVDDGRELLKYAAPPFVIRF